MRKFYSLLIVAAFVAATPVYAIDFTTKLYSIGGAQFRDDKGAPTDLLLGTVAEIALLTPDASETTGEAKAKAFWLAAKLHVKNGPEFSKDVTLTAEEVALIKKKIGTTYGPAVVGAAWLVLDPASVKGDVK